MHDALRHLVLIHEHGTFTAAARYAHLSQPALTASIRRLEEQVGAALLHRGRSGARLTAAGEAFLPLARESLAALADGIRAVEQIEGLHAGEVRLGAGATACSYLLPPALARYRTAHPNIRYFLRESTSHDSLESLARGELDLVIADEGVDPWFTDELILVAAPGTDTTDAPFVTLRRGATTRALLDQYFPHANIVMELGSISGMKGNVRAGIGMALVSRHAVVNDLRERRLVRVRDTRTPCLRPLFLAHRGVDRLPPAVAALRDVLLSSAATRHLRRRRRVSSKDR